MNINNIEFKTKSALILYIQEIVKQTPLNTDVSAGNLKFLIELLKNHPTAKQKIGCGIKRMWTRKNPIYPTINLYLERLDGTTTDFSWRECIIETKQIRKFASACRSAVSDIVFQFAQRELSKSNPICPLTGELITRDNCHVDHYDPDFKEIVSSFIEDHKIDPNLAGIAVSEDNKIGDYFVDLNLKSNFIEYHNNKAKLRITTDKGNLKRKKK